MTLAEYKQAAPEFAAYTLKSFPWASWADWAKLYALYQLGYDKGVATQIQGRREARERYEQTIEQALENTCER